MLNRMLLLTMITLIAGLCWMTWYGLDRPIEKFVVRGDLSASEQDKVNEVLAAAEFSGILSTSLTDVAATLQQLPWATSVSVRRDWPHTMVVNLQRAHPIARWGDQQYLSASGELIVLPDSYMGLPLFDIAVQTPAQTMGVYRLLDQILARASLRISRLVQNRQGEWTVEIKDLQQHATLQLLLGAEQLNERTHRFLLLHRQVLADAGQQVAYVDARYASGLAVRYQPAEMADELTDNGIAALSGQLQVPSYPFPGGSN